MKPKVSTQAESASRLSRSEAKAGNRRALLEAAGREVRRVGPRAMNLDAVAEAAGLTKGAIYSIFGGKSQLLRALAQESSLDLAWPELEPARADVDLAGQLEAFAALWAQGRALRAPLAEHAAQAELYAEILRDPALFDDMGATMSRQHAAVASALAGRMDADGVPVDRRRAEALASAFIALMQGLTQRAVYQRLEFPSTLYMDAARTLASLGST